MLSIVIPYSFKFLNSVFYAYNFFSSLSKNVNGCSPNFNENCNDNFYEQLLLKPFFG